MKVTYADKKRQAVPANKAEQSRQPSLDAFISGSATPSQEQLGHRVDLPDAMLEKMENAFGADLSAVKLYESQVVEDADAKAVAQGSNIAFAPGMLDFTSYGGQALLGHEISHVVSQARGEVTGSGYLNDHALEARADREGAMAASGQQIAVPTEAMSPVTAAPASGPMQCGGKDDRRQRQANEYRDKEMQAYDDYIQAKDPKERARLKAEYQQNRDLKAGRLRKLKMSEQDIEADNRKTTSPMAQLQRAHDRHIPARVYAEGNTSDEEAGKIRERQSTAFLGNIQSIMDNLSDDELKADTQFQKAVVDSYSGAYRRLYPKGVPAGGNGDAAGSGEEIKNPFLPKSGGRDLLGTMYGRLMGPNDIRAALEKNSDDESINDLGALAESSGVSELMDRQYDKVFRMSRTKSGVTDMKTHRGAMRELLASTVAPMMWDSKRASARVSHLDSVLSQPIPEPKVEEEPQRSIKEIMTEEEYADHMAQVEEVEEGARQRKAAMDKANSPITKLTTTASNAINTVREGVEDMAWSVKDHFAERSEQKQKAKDEKERQRNEEKDRKK